MNDEVTLATANIVVAVPLNLVPIQALSNQGLLFQLLSDRLGKQPIYVLSDLLDDVTEAIKRQVSSEKFALNGEKGVEAALVMITAITGRVLMGYNEMLTAAGIQLDRYAFAANLALADEVVLVLVRDADTNEEAIIVGFPEQAHEVGAIVDETQIVRAGTATRH